MKKIIFMFLILFLCILNIKANESFYLGEKVSDMYIESIKGENMHNGAPFLLHKSDGGIVYCLNPFQMMDTTNMYKSYNYNNSIFNISNEILNKLNIISYLGYGYTNHTDIKWYGITQYLIWKNLGMDDIYFTDAYYGNRVEKYVSEVNELEKLVNDYYILPSFAGETYKYEINKEYNIYDKNGVINNYEIKESNIEVTKIDNGLNIKTKSEGEYYITFVKKSPVNNQYLLFNLDGAQQLLYPGKLDDIIFTVKIIVKAGSVTVTINDIENIDLNNYKVELYKDHLFYTYLKFNESGISYIDKLPYGEYVIKPIQIEGYESEHSSYNFYVQRNYEDQIVNISFEKIKGNIIINKYYGEENNYMLDDNATFEVYKNNTLIKTINSGEKEQLEYGKYKIIQISGKKYYSLSDEFEIEVLSSKVYKYELYTEMEDELKNFLNIKEEELIDKENELLKLEEELNNLKNELKKEEENNRLKYEELSKLQEELELKKIELDELEIDIENRKKEIDCLSKNLEDNSVLLEEKNNQLLLKEKQLNQLQEELNLLSISLYEKQQEINNLEKSINSKKNEILENERTLVVEVPNTYKKNYYKLISIILIFIGSQTIVLNMKKVTNH